MVFNNQRKVALATIACLIGQGYLFTHVLHVEPHFIVAIAPIIPYVIYIFALAKRAMRFDQPLIWIAAIVGLTIINIAPYALPVIT